MFRIAQPFLTPALRFQLKHTRARNANVRLSVQRVQKVTEDAEVQRKEDQKKAAEAKIRRIYSAVPHSRADPLTHLPDPGVKRLGQIAPAALELLYSEQSQSHPWLHSDSDSSYEEVPYESSDI